MNLLEKKIGRSVGVTECDDVHVCGQGQEGHQAGSPFVIDLGTRAEGETQHSKRGQHGSRRDTDE